MASEGLAKRLLYCWNGKPLPRRLWISITDMFDGVLKSEMHNGDR
jgi:hypothetical protein